MVEAVVEIPIAAEVEFPIESPIISGIFVDVQVASLGIPVIPVIPGIRGISVDHVVVAPDDEIPIASAVELNPTTEHNYNLIFVVRQSAPKTITRPNS